MRKLLRRILTGAALALPLAFVTAPVSALPGAAHGAVFDNVTSSDIVEVKGGRGGGRGWGRGHRGFKAMGWSQGRKVGWRGRGCPPGQWKKGRC